eukprot:1157363-Pelagomonas_calceolata.AAC.2
MALCMVVRNLLGRTGAAQTNKDDGGLPGCTYMYPDLVALIFLARASHLLSSACCLVREWHTAGTRFEEANDLLPNVTLVLNLTRFRVTWCSPQHSCFGAS